MAMIVLPLLGCVVKISTAFDYLTSQHMEIIIEFMFLCNV